METSDFEREVQYVDTLSHKDRKTYLEEVERTRGQQVKQCLVRALIDYWHRNH